jgi:hypothetical protein
MSMFSVLFFYPLLVVFATYHMIKKPVTVGLQVQKG